VSTVYLVDNSVIQRLHRSPEVRSARDALLRIGDLAVCLPTVLEACFSARSYQEHQQEANAYMTAWTVLEPAPEVMEIALLLQSKLFNAGKGRSVGVSDLQIAATAMHYDTEERPVVVAHYDADFDHLQSVEPSLRTQWVVPRGTVA
jgi:predicted nucleic acid-binding protein